MRGLSYYTGVVFEAFDRKGELRAICGGGRYDRLLSAYGGDDQPCAGFGFGDAVIVELLQDRGLLPSALLKLAGPDDVVAPLDEASRADAVALASRLRAAGRRVDLLLEEPRKAKAVSKRAAAAGAARLLMLGGEVPAGSVRVKRLAEFAEETVRAEDVE